MTNYHSVKFDSAAHYHITVQGKLDTDLLDLVRAEEHQQEIHTDKMITTIKVYVKDQAQLSGILNILYDRHHTILIVECTHND